MTAYKITASHNGIAQDSAEVLGDAYGKTYIDRVEADVICADLNDTADDYYPGTIYSVIEAQYA